MEDFNIDLVAGNVKAAMRGAQAVSADLWQVMPDELRVLDGFNVRIKNDAYRARVRWIADSIKANGYYKDRPLSGFVADEDGKNVIYITGGHRRFEAVILAVSEGIEPFRVPVVVKPKGTSMEDLTVDLIVENEGDPLATYEQALACKRLATFGRTSKEIAARVGFKSGAQYVDGLLALAGAPLPIRKMVMEEIVSPTTAIAAIRKHGGKATDVLLAAVVAAGGGRVTPKAMPGVAFTKAIRKHAETFHSTLAQVQADPGYAYLSLELRETLRKLMDSVKGGT